MDAYERLVHYAEVSAESELSRAPLSVYKLSNATVHRRNKAVNWINVITSLTGCNIETKHTCIHIFDMYVASFFVEDRKPIENWKFVSLTAAAASLIGTKIHYSKKALTVESFPYFQAHDLVNCERLILEKIDYNIDPSYSSVSFIKCILHVWPGCKTRHEELQKEAFILADKFVLSFESVQYSPMTIAVSALLLAFLKLDIDSSEWLQSLPSRCYSSVDASGCKVVDKCLESFIACNQSVGESTCTDKLSNNSPTTVTAMIENKLSITTTIIDAIPTPSITPSVENLGCDNFEATKEMINEAANYGSNDRNKDYEVNEVTGNTFAPIQIHSSSSQHNLPDGIMELKRPVPRSLGLESRKRDLKRTLNNDGEVCPVCPVKIQKKEDLI